MHDSRITTTNFIIAGIAIILWIGAMFYLYRMANLLDVETEAEVVTPPTQTEPLPEYEIPEGHEDVKG